MKQESYHIKGMTCAACVANVEAVLKKNKGIDDAQVSLATHQAVLKENEQFQFEEVKNALNKFGYDIEVPQKTIETNKEQHTQLIKTIVAAGLSLGMFFAMKFISNHFISGMVQMLLAWGVLFYCASGFFVSAYKKAKHGQTNMDTLIALGSGVAVVYSTVVLFAVKDFGHLHFMAAGMIVTFIQFGKYLEAKAGNQTSSALRALMKLQQKTAHKILAGGEIETTDIEKLQVGDLLLVKPYESIPLDAIIVSGQTHVDESLVSGESMPLAKIENDDLIGGSINQEGSIQVKVRHSVGNGFLQKISKAVAGAMSSKAQIQSTADKIASVFVPVIMLIAMLTAITWFFITKDVYLSVSAMVSVLVVACPCAMGLATPTAIITAVGAMSQKGILVKNAQAIEHAASVDTLVFDKTSTLSKGKAAVVDLRIKNKELLSYLFEISSLSSHPLAKAICLYLENGKDDFTKVKFDKTEEIASKGVVAQLNELHFYLGNPKWMDELGVSDPFELMNAVEGSMVCFARNQQLEAVVLLEDELKNESKVTVAALSKNFDIHILSGDNEQAVKKAADDLHIKHFKAACLPEDKLEYIKTLQTEGKKVAMIGDGINDSPALAQADLSIAMTTGTEVALKTADLSLLNGNLENLTWFFEHAKKSLRIIKQNLFWAFAYNLIALPVAAGVLYPFTGQLLHPSWAALAMALSSVSVVLNSLRLSIHNKTL